MTVNTKHAAALVAMFGAVFAAAKFALMGPIARVEKKVDDIKENLEVTTNLVGAVVTSIPFITLEKLGFGQEKKTGKIVELTRPENATFRR